MVWNKSLFDVRIQKKRIGWFALMIPFVIARADPCSALYTVFVCSDTSYEHAMESMRRDIPDPIADIYIIRSDAGPYRMAYGTFATLEEAKRFRENLPARLKKRLPYIQKVETCYLSRSDGGKVSKFSYADKSLTDQTAAAEEKEGDAIDRYDPEPIEQVVVYVDSNRNRMYVNAYQNGEKSRIGTFDISSGKKDIKKPTGRGHITSIAFDPIWYPTRETIKHFRNVRKIDLPAAVPPGSPYNYMGPAKISLSHTVEGRQTYRIHGTLNEKSIGTHESAGCIRMRNDEVLRLARFLKRYASHKGMERIAVVIE